MKKLFSILLVLIIFINSIVPHYALAATAPDELPEIPDWFKEKYCKDDIQKCYENFDDDIKGKNIKTIKKPTKLKNPTPVGIGFYLVSEFILKESETYREMEQEFWDTINYLDLAAAEYLHSKGIHGWGDIFEKVTVGSYQFTDKFIDAISEVFFSADANLDENIEAMLDDLTNSFTAKYPAIILEQALDFQTTYIVKGGFYRQKRTDRLHFLLELLSVRKFSDGKIRYKSELYWARSGDSLFNAAYYGIPYTVSGSNVTVLEPESIWEARERLKPYYDDFVKVFEKPEDNPNLDKIESLKGAILTNPLGSRLINPEENELTGVQKGIIEIEDKPYHIVEIPNPAHTPHLPVTDPNYVSEYYPIITPVYPEYPNIYPNPKPMFPNLPEPTPQPSPEPSPDPTPQPSPDPQPSPQPPAIPEAPEQEFGKGKGCRELDLELKSIDLFTTKFPFSIPWDVYRALEAFFGKMGSEEPRFVLSFISDDVILELPDFIKDWVPLVRTLILFIFDISIIYALYRWFGGAS